MTQVAEKLDYHVLTWRQSHDEMSFRHVLYSYESQKEKTAQRLNSVYGIDANQVRSQLEATLLRCCEKFEPQGQPFDHYAARAIRNTEREIIRQHEKEVEHFRDKETENIQHESKWFEILEIPDANRVDEQVIREQEKSDLRQQIACLYANTGDFTRELLTLLLYDQEADSFYSPNGSVNVTELSKQLNVSRNRIYRNLDKLKSQLFETANINELSVWAS